jgi:hypothetical protein
LSDNAKSIIVKVSKAASAALDEFHFSVEAFSDTIVFSKAPHGGNGFDPLFEGLGEVSYRAKVAVISGTKHICR